MKEKTTKFLVKAGLIAALYFVSTTLISPIAFGQNQVRISEALNVLVYFTPSAIYGLTLGCALANLSSPFGLVDIIFGSLATFVSGKLAHKIKNKYLVPIPTIIVNGLVVGSILYKMTAFPFVAGFLSVSLGQAISTYIIGVPLILVIEKNEVLCRFLKD